MDLHNAPPTVPRHHSHSFQELAITLPVLLGPGSQALAQEPEGLALLLDYTKPLEQGWRLREPELYSERLL